MLCRGDIKAKVVIQAPSTPLPGSFIIAHIVQEYTTVMINMRCRAHTNGGFYVVLLLLPSVAWFHLFLGRPLVSPLAVVARPGRYNPFVDIVGAPGLVSTLGLFLKSVSCSCPGMHAEKSSLQLTGRPQGVTGCLPPLDLPRPPP